MTHEQQMYNYWDDKVGEMRTTLFEAARAQPYICGSLNQVFARATRDLVVVES